MNYFLEAMETIPDGVGFSHFGSVHITWLIVFVIVTVLNCTGYRKLPNSKRKCWRITVGSLLLMNELLKVIVLLLAGNYSWAYLPLHLCSINIFLVLWHICKPTKLLGNFLYAVGIPGAIAALLFPVWTSLPITSALHIHSFMAHILLALYPVVLTVAGEIQPDIKQLPLCLLLLLSFVIPTYGINLLLGTNFMFLMWADPGNPLYWFDQNWGSHLLGFPVIITGVLLVMHLPIVLYRKFRKA